MPEPTPEAWAQIRHDYEHTDRPLAHICAEHGITDPMLRYRVKRWKWQKRRSLIPRQGPPPVDVFSSPPVRAANGGEGIDGPWPPPFVNKDADAKHRLWVGGENVPASDLPPTPLRLADASRSDPPHRFTGGGKEEETSIVPRLQSAVARVLPAIEATIARLSATQHPREMEQAGRTLGALTRALRELTALLAQHKAETGDGEAPSPQDIDEFRDELARRLKGIIEARKAARLEKT